MPAPGCAGKCAAGTRDICWIDPGMLRKGEQQRFFSAEVIENPRYKFRLGGSAFGRTAVGDGKLGFGRLDCDFHFSFSRLCGRRPG